MRNRVYSDTGIDMDAARDFVCRIFPEASKDPVGAVQQLLNSGEMSQAQLNRYMKTVRQMQENPGIAERFNREILENVNEYMATLSGDALRRAMSALREIE